MTGTYIAPELVQLVVYESRSGVRPHLRRLSLLAAMSLVLLTGGCSKGSGATGSAGSVGNLRYLGSSFGIALRMQAGKLWSIGGLVLCVDGIPASIESIRAGDTHGAIDVTAWGYRPNPVRTGGVLLGADSKSLASLGFTTSSPATIDTRCIEGGSTSAQDAPAYELGIQVTATGTENAWVDGLVVHYTTFGRKGTLAIPWEVAVCAITASTPVTAPCYGSTAGS